MTNLSAKAQEYFKQQPIMAILRGISVNSAADYGRALYQANIKMIEVPLTHTAAMEAIAVLIKTLPNDCLIGAGTVTSIEQVEQLSAIGATLAVSPHTDPLLIQQAISLGLLPMPGVATPTEAFQALQAGAKFLKVFPAASFGPRHISALATVLPNDSHLIAVGGVKLTEKNLWLNAGATGLGIGSDIFSTSDTYEDFIDKLELVY